MCGRFSLTASLEEIRQNFSLDVVTCELEPRSEVFPSQQVPAIILHDSKIRLGQLTWGLIPSWAKEKKGTGHINARMESLAQKPSFKASFKKRRCLVIADGFYEWKADLEKANRKIRYYFQLPSKTPFAFAGLWDTWQKDYHGCTIVTKESVGEIRDIHDRMPCILKPEAYQAWIDSSYQDTNGLNELLRDSCVQELIFNES
jgi:putative SOS response-associated peptidase YedK